MKTSRLFVVVSAMALLGAGCASTPAPKVVPPPPPPASTVEVPAAQPGYPPVVVMLVDDEVYPGVEGSYCYEGMCADKVAPSYSDFVYKDVNGGATVSFAVGKEDPVFEFAVHVVDIGVALEDTYDRVPVRFRNGVYTAEIPKVAGKHVVEAFVRFGQTNTGGDVTYYFPVNVR